MMLPGRVVGASSPFARLDPRVKIVVLVLCASLSFLVSDVATALFMGTLLLALFALAQVPLRVALSCVRPFIPLLVISFFVNALVVPGGAVLAQLGPVAVTQRGVEYGLLASYRAVVALGFGALLVATTSPVSLANGLEKLLAPLGLFGVSVPDVAMILSIALRTIPLLSDEAARVVNAQKSRGAHGFDGSLLERMKTYAALIVPLLESSLLHAERLAVAMDARCYAAPCERTHLSPLRFAARDAFAVALAVAALAAFVVLRTVL